jgi:ABC-2 type transport system permease protein
MKELSVYWTLMRLKMKSQFEYRTAFILGFISKIFGWGSGFVLIWLLISRFGSIGGWSTYEVLFLYSLDLLSYSLIASFVMNPCSRLPQVIQSGEFDEILTRPLNNFLYFFFSFFSTGYLSNILMSTAVIALCMVKLHIELNGFTGFFLIVTLLGGALIQGAGFLFSAIPAFWMVKNDSLRGLLLFDLKSFIRYPLSIYNKTVQIFLTLVIPYAFINFFPAQLFLKKNDYLMFHPIFQYLTPFIGLFLFISSYFFWRFGINHYESTGS